MNKLILLTYLLFVSLMPGVTYAQQEPEQQDLVASTAPSVAREWSEALLNAIRRDLARPTVHARNLYHLSVAMFDAWAIYVPTATPLFIHPQNPHEVCQRLAQSRLVTETDTTVEPGENAASTDTQEAQAQAVGYAAWTLLNHRFRRSRQSTELLEQFRQVAQGQGLDERRFEELQTAAGSIDAADTSDAIGIGVQVGECVIAMGLNDQSNEQNDYANQDYSPLNPPLDPFSPGNPGVLDPNRWQPLQLELFIGQSGIVTDTPVFLGADWGRVTPFAMRTPDKTEIVIDGVAVPVWHGPVPPPILGNDPDTNLVYQRNHLLVALWSAHLDPESGETIDISPGALGNLPPLAGFPDQQALILEEYDSLNGGVSGSNGHAVNPFTSEPYVENVVPLGDYTRVLAEFWADGLDSETPPGHWFRIYNDAVAGHPAHDLRLAGRGQEIDPLTYDVVAYLALGGALHDSAIAAWSVKRAYDYARPITAIRYMAALGQSSDPVGPSYNPEGVPLVPGRVEVVTAEDPLAVIDSRNTGKIKALVWRGPDFIADPASDTAGVGWQLLENWWPYQRPTFVTPPFAGYVSGHSTFSRAAAEVLTKLTGDEFFPGGYAEFLAPRNQFLVFERGPSVDVKLQWATYRDAADQTGLSRIWGGIHPPADDLVARKMGEKIGLKAWQQVTSLVAETFPDSLPDAVPVSSAGTDFFAFETSAADTTGDSPIDSEPVTDSPSLSNSGTSGGGFMSWGSVVLLLLLVMLGKIGLRSGIGPNCPN